MVSWEPAAASAAGFSSRKRCVVVDGMTDQKKEEPKVFRRKLKVVPIQMEEDDGQVRTYHIRETDGKARGEFIRERAVAIADGKVDEEKAQALSMGYIAKCLLDPEMKPIDVKDLIKFPSETLDELFKECLKVSGLDPDAMEKAKNDSAARKETGSTSPTA
jgi:hypothetical protein